MEYKVFTDRNISRDIYELEVEGKRVLMFYFQRTIPTLGLNQSQVGDYKVLTLPGTVIDENYSLLLLENSDIDLATTVLLDKVQKGKANSLSREAIKFLRSKKYIEGRMPKVYVSKQVAQVTDQKAEYSMHKGLEYKKCKALLQDALEDHKFLTREEIDKLWWNLLSDVLSDKQKKAKVGNMLTKMREERIIVNETKGNVSVWSLLKTKK